VLHIVGRVQALYAHLARGWQVAVETGDSRLSVRYHCGRPLLQDSSCVPVYYLPRLQLVPEPFARSVVPCLVVDEWLYDQGPGNLAATVRFRAGVVLSITFGTQATP